MSTPRIGPALVAALLLGGCAPAMVKVDTGELTINDAMRVTLTQSWNRFEARGLPVRVSPMGAHELWTSDGLTLDVLAFFAGIGEGQPVGTALPGSKKDLPTFRAGMSPHEIVELYEALVTQDGSVFSLRRLGPASLGEAGGFRFEHALTRRADGLRLAGVGYGAVVQGRLHLITYTAPRSEFYVGKAAGVEAVAASARIHSPPAIAAAARKPTPLFGPDAKRFERGADSGGNVSFESTGGDGRCSSWAACGGREPREANRTPTSR